MCPEVEEFSRIVPLELAQNFMSRIWKGTTVAFPNHYELDQLRNEFDGCFGGVGYMKRDGDNFSPVPCVDSAEESHLLPGNGAGWPD
jgi:hypothetical protein